LKNDQRSSSSTFVPPGIFGYEGLERVTESRSQGRQKCSKPPAGQHDVLVNTSGKSTTTGQRNGRRKRLRPESTWDICTRYAGADPVGVFQNLKLTKRKKKSLLRRVNQLSSSTDSTNDLTNRKRITTASTATLRTLQKKKSSCASSSPGK